MRRTRLVVVATFLAAPLAAQACVGDSTSPTDGGPTKDGTVNDVQAGDGSGGDGGNACTPGCVADGSVYRACDAGAAVDTTCDWSCVGTPSAHCGVFNPTGLVEPSDFATAGLSDLDPCPADAGQNFGCSFVFHTDTGKIDDGASNVLRPINANPQTTEVGNGIAFRVASYDAGTDKLAIFVVKNFYLRGGEIHFAGPNPVAIVAQNDIEIHGLVDMWDTQFFGQCNAAAGGGAPGNTGQASPSLGGGGAGDGQGTTYSAGGGGGGSAGAGGAGGDNNLNVHGGAAGPAFSEGFNPLRGGGGGGGGGAGTAGLGGGGGAGGGAIALFANGTITITPGGGTTWGINAGGCGSPPGGNFSNNGGAGAGGAILIQAHNVVGLGDAGIAANGGSGGNGNLGVRGQISVTPTQGAAASAPCYGAGGNGGANATQATNGQQQPGSCSQTSYGGGGGGGLGRIAIGAFTAPILDAGFIVSPPPTNMAPPIE